MPEWILLRRKYKGLRYTDSADRDNLSRLPLGQGVSMKIGILFKLMWPGFCKQWKNREGKDAKASR